MVLLRSLPEKCRSYCLLHGGSNSFEDLKRVALKFEVQRRVWSEGVGNKLNPFQPNPKGKGGDEKGKGKGKKEPRARSQSASKGSKATKDTVCYNCNKKGHFARDCWSSKRDKDAKDHPDGGKAKGKAKPKPKSGSKDNSKGKGKGKTVAEVVANDSDGVNLRGDQEWAESEGESQVRSVLQQLQGIVDEARQDWIPQKEDSITWQTWQPLVGLSKDISLSVRRVSWRRWWW